MIEIWKRVKKCPLSYAHQRYIIYEIPLLFLQYFFLSLLSKTRNRENERDNSATILLTRIRHYENNGIIFMKIISNNLLPLFWYSFFSLVLFFSSWFFLSTAILLFNQFFFASFLHHIELPVLVSPSTTFFDIFHRDGNKNNIILLFWIHFRKWMTFFRQIFSFRSVLFYFRGFLCVSGRFVCGVIFFRISSAEMLMQLIVVWVSFCRVYFVISSACSIPFSAND